MDPVLKAALERRNAAQAEINNLLDIPGTENRGLNEAEQGSFDKLSDEINGLDRQIINLEANEARNAAAAAAAAALAGNGDVDPNGAPGNVTVRSEPRTYDEFGSNSYLRDMALIATSHLGGTDASESRARMARHAQEVEIEARTNPRVDRQLRGIRADLKSRSGAVGEYEKRVNPSTAAGQGGEFVPPLWLENEYVALQRPGRVFANRVTNRPLPGGIDVINIPKITAGSLTGVQTQQGGAVASQDITTGVSSAPVVTIAGQEDVSVQLLEQSPLSLDGVIFDDLSADYDQRLDYQVVAGTGANGQHKGVLFVPGATSNTNQQQASRVVVASPVFFDATTLGSQYRSVINGVNQIETLRFASPTAIWAHPRRPNSWATAADTTNRPLFTAPQYLSYNSPGNNEAHSTPQGLAGEVFGLPVIKDANMPVSMNAFSIGAGTADPIVILKEDDILLFEGTMRMRALPEVLSGTLQVRFQLYNYSALICDRLPAAISVLTGNTGLAQPTF